VFGEVREGHFGLEIVNPQFKVIEPGMPLPDRLTPVYPTTAGLSQETLRKLTARALAADPALTAETLPDWLIAKRRLWKFGDAIRFLHAPPPRLSSLAQRALDERTHPAWTRLKFDELVAQQLSLKAHRKARAMKRAPVLTGTGALTGALLSRLPFKLTRAQERVWREIRFDLARTTPMQRLLQGDVGSGKTVVAALAALQAIESGRQAAFMAPTEILAEQHYRKLMQWLENLPVQIAWLSGGLPAKQRKAALAAMGSGDAMFAIGTHALFEDEVLLPRLGLLIVDEQHRFGVAQRLKLRGKATGEAHQLMMSATPIPRTLAMTFYADLDVSMLDEMPPGRTPVATRLVSQKRRREVVERVRKACAEGRQAYWVCPLIEESEELRYQAAEETAAALAEALPEVRVGLVHGRMPPRDKERGMYAFKEGKIGLLVATTVIEVGVDVPNATLMVIENAERMGLAQLHQLRGRVGRGAHESHCVLLYGGKLSEMARARLAAIRETNDGFVIARRDLELRGPGEMLGTRQTGLAEMRVADLMRDSDLLPAVQAAAETLLKHNPEAVRALTRRWVGSGERYGRIG